MAATLDGRDTMVCTYGAGISVLTTGDGRASESMQYAPEEAIRLAEEMIEVARAQIARFAGN